MDDTNAALRQLIARQAISDCLQRYARGIDRFDPELVASCYHPDAIDDHGAYIGPGTDLGVWASQLMAGSEMVHHHLTNHHVDLDLEGDTAHAETYYLSIIRGSAGTTALVTGRYLDRFACRDGAWKIAARVCMVEAVCDVPSGDMERSLRTYVQGARDRTDVSYERPLQVSRPATSGAPRSPRTA